MMLNKNQHSTVYQGSIMMSLAVIIFLLSLGAAAFITWQLQGLPWANNLSARALAPVPVASNAIPLTPGLTIAPELEQYRPQIMSELVDPLRQYYATKTERLGDIAVAVSNVKKYAAKIRIELQTEVGQNTATFYFGAAKDGAAQFTPWDPSAFDQTK